MRVGMQHSELVASAGQPASAVMPPPSRRQPLPPPALNASNSNTPQAAARLAAPCSAFAYCPLPSACVSGGCKTFNGSTTWAPPSLHGPIPLIVLPPFLCPAQHGWRWDGQNLPGTDSHPPVLGATATPRSRECNHDYAGESFNAPALPAPVKSGGFMVTTNRKKVDCSSQLVIDGVTE